MPRSTEGVRAELARRGHTLEMSSGPVGTPVMLYIDPAERTFHAAGDPAAGRHAAGLSATR